MNISIEQAVRIGASYIEESIIEVLSRNPEEYIRAADISRTIGLGAWDHNRWVIKGFLEKLKLDGRVEPRMSGSRSTGWKVVRTRT